MGIETLTSAARAAGFAMVATDDLVSPPPRHAHAPASRTVEAPSADAPRAIEQKRQDGVPAVWWPFWKFA